MADSTINPFDNAEEIAKKSLVIFFIIDQSGSMEGTKIGILNQVMEEVLAEIKNVGEADADVKVAVLTFSTGSTWMNTEPVSVENFQWKRIAAGGLTDLGAAFTKLSEKMSKKEFLATPSLSFAPVMFLMSDGYPTDDYKIGLEKLKSNKWYKAGIKFALAIGNDANEDILAEFAGSREAVVKACNGEQLSQLIRLVTVTSSQIGSRSVALTDEGDGGRSQKQLAVEEQIQDFIASGDFAQADEEGW